MGPQRIFLICCLGPNSLGNLHISISASHAYVVPLSARMGHPLSDFPPFPALWHRCLHHADMSRHMLTAMMLHRSVPNNISSGQLSRRRSGMRRPGVRARARSCGLSGSCRRSGPRGARSCCSWLHPPRAWRPCTASCCRLHQCSQCPGAPQPAQQTNSVKCVQHDMRQEWFTATTGCTEPQSRLLNGAHMLVIITLMIDGMCSTAWTSVYHGV